MRAEEGGWPRWEFSPRAWFLYTHMYCVDGAPSDARRSLGGISAKIDRLSGVVESGDLSGAVTISPNGRLVLKS